MFLITSNTFAQEQKLEQKIDISCNNISASDLVQDLEQKTGIHFSYNSGLLKNKQIRSYTANNKPLKVVLEELSEILELDFVLVEQQIVIKKKRRQDKVKPKKVYTISGTIKDDETGESLIGATILVSGTRIGTITNSYGFFSLSLPEGLYNIEISYVGYLADVITIDLKKNISHNAQLKYNMQLMADVMVKVSEMDKNLKEPSMSRVKLIAKDLDKFPEFAGEVGLIKTMESLPGIQTFGDGSSFFFVRGGNKDQNLILLDEAPIYNPSHLLGFYSVVNPEVAKEIKIYKADMPVEFGDKISSVTTIQTRDGNMKQVGFSGMVNPFVYRISVESPIVKERASVFASFRHSTFNWLFRRAAPDLDIRFHDYNVKFKYKINDKNRLYYSFYSGKDNISNVSSENLGFGIDWSNFASTLRWNHIFNEKLFSNTTLYGSAYNYNLQVNESNKIKWNSYIRNLSLKTDLTYYLRAHHTIKFGYALNFHSFNPGNINIDEVAVIPQKQSNQIVLYADDNYKLGEKWDFGLGFRLSNWNNSGPSTVYTFDEDYQVIDTITANNNTTYKSFFNLDPRIHIKYQINLQSSLKLSYGIYHQYIHLLSNSSGPFTSLDVWVPSGINIDPQRSDIIALGHEIWFSKERYELVTELYYKKMHNQIAYADHANMLLNPLMEGELRFGEANAYGLEIMLRKRKGQLSGWFSYTYSRILMQFDDINNGKVFPAYFDKPHSISLYGNYQLSERWHLSANWIFASGAPITSPIGFYTHMDNTVPLYGDVNNDRLPNYHRLDVSINWRLNKRIKRFQHRIAFSIYNLYNQKNAISRHHNKIRTGDNSFAIPSNVYNQNQMISTESYMLGFMPSFTYKFEF